MLENFQPTVLRVFGGLCTFIDRAAMALGMAPVCQNARFAPGMVATRDAYRVILTDTAQPFYGVTQLVRADGERHTLVLTDNGRLKVENPEGTLTLLEEHIGQYPMLKSASLFSTQYMCFSDGKLGISQLHRYDGSRIGLVGAGSPGKAPTLADGGAVTAGLLAGIHCVVVVFVNRARDISGWSPIASITLGSDNRALNVTVPLGPPDTVQRVVAITPRNDGRNFLYTAKTVVNDNTTATAITFTLSEQELIESELSVSRWITSYVPWLPAGCAVSQERLFLWGSRATLQPSYIMDSTVSATVLQNVGFWNLAFNGGFTSTTPNGWTPTGAGQAVGGETGSPFEGKCFRITGDAASTTRGKVSQTARNDETFMRPQVRYGVAVLMRSSHPSAGNLCVDVSGSIGGTFLQARFPCGTMAEEKWISATYEMATPLTVDEKTITIDVYWNGTSGFGVGKFVECQVALYDADDSQHLHTLAVSDPANPGTFVGETCSLDIGPDDGEGIRNVFRIRDVLYAAKERSLHAIVSTTSGEPRTWSANLVHPYAGTPSLHGVAIDGAFALIAGRDGLYLFDGASPRLVSREVEPTWRGADWSLGHRVVLVLDPAKEIVRAALPASSDLEGASLLFTLDYKEGWDSPVPGGSGPKWAIDTFVCDPVAQVLAGALLLTSTGVHVPVLSMRAGSVHNRAVSRDFTAAVWTWAPADPTISLGQPDGRSGNYGVGWDWANTLVATYPAAVSYGPVAIVSFRVCRTGTNAVTLTVSSPAFANTTVVSLEKDRWTRVVAYFYDLITPPSVPVFVDFVVTLAGGVTTNSVVMADMQIDWQTQRADLGFADTSAGASAGPCAILVTPTTNLRRDFSGRIPFRYDTAPFGADAGRSLFDRAVLRAQGDGYLAASYLGVGTRSWAMTPVQLAADPDEDVEYGANLHSPAACLSLTTTSEDGWVLLKRVVVASLAEKIGFLRGRNG